LIRRPLVVAAVCVTAALILVACGGGSDEAATTTLPTTTTTTLPGGEFCEIARSYYDKVLSLGASLGDPQRLRDLLRETGPVIDRVEATAPPEIASDVRLAAATSRQLLAELEAVDFDYSRLPPGTVQRIQTPESQAAAIRLQTYTRDVCGVGR
jgi:hypothetical protein